MEEQLNKSQDSKAFFPTLVSAISSIDTPGLVLNVSLIEVAAGLGVSLSVAGQIQSITSAVGIVSALVVGLVSAQFSYKRLLMSGLALVVLSALLCSVAPTFSLLALSFSFMGVVTSLVGPMVFTYIGEHYPNEGRARAVGMLSASRTLIYLVMVQLIGFVVGQLGWRATFLVLVAPLALLGLAATHLILPEKKAQNQTSNKSIFNGYRMVLSSRSAVANLLGNSMCAAAWAGGVILYSVSFLRNIFSLTRGDATIIFSGLVVGVLVGNYIGGLVAVRIGRKKTVVISSLLTGALIVTYLNVLNLNLVFGIAALMSLSAGVVLTAANSLILEQVPGYRGTIMSMNAAAVQLGVAAGAAVGGLTLQLSGWGAVGAVLGFIQLLAALIFQLGVSSLEGK